MSSKRSLFLLPFLFFILITASSVDFSSRKIMEEKNSLAALESAGTPATAEPEQKSAAVQSKNFKLEEKLVNREEVDGYIVETYREYEIYTDSQGNVKESVPTSNYNYIRYQEE